MILKIDSIAELNLLL